jgi:hypothetical protein
MNSLLQSSLMGHDFVKYRKDNDERERVKFSNSVRTKGIGEIPIVIDSVEETINLALSSYDKIYLNKKGREYRFHMGLTIDDVLLEVKKKINLSDTKILKVGLENGKILDNKDILGELYKKYKNPKDNILYLLLTQETTIYGYIISLLRSIFGATFMKTS